MSVEIFRIGGKKFVIRTSNGLETVTLLKPNGLEKFSHYRADVVRVLGEMVWYPPKMVTERDNHRPMPVAVGAR